MTENPGMDVEGAVVRVAALLDARHAETVRDWLRAAATWPNAAGFLSRVATAKDQAPLQDYLAELLYALVFRGLGFELCFEPCGPKGPDLGISRAGVSGTVEVTRFRPMNPGPPAVAAGDLADFEFLVYGNPERDTAKAIAKVRHKFRQAAGDRFIIALWNNDDALEEREVSAAAPQWARDPERPEALQFVVYGSPWIGARQLHCFPMAGGLDEQTGKWIHDLEAASVSTAVATGLAVEQGNKSLATPGG